MANKILFTLTIGIILLIYRNWFMSPEIIGGDWPYFYEDVIKNFSFFPPAWSSVHGNGLGGTILSYAVDTYLYISGFLSVNIFHIPWVIGYKIIWFSAFLVFCSVSIICLYRQLTNDRSWLGSSIAVCIYTTNTYILMVVGGGQMGVALAYSLSPLMLVSFIQLYKTVQANGQRNIFRSVIITCFIVGLVMFFDPRLLYIIGLVITLFLLGNCYFLFKNATPLYALKNVFKRIMLVIIPVAIGILLNAFWIMPLLFVEQVSLSSLGVVENVSDSLRFFSFANFSNSFSLLHPNWPENVFGKVSFMRSEFLLIPIVAYGFLLNANRKTQSVKPQLKSQSIQSNITTSPSGRQVKQYNNRAMLYFGLVGLLGAFLAKGVNPPFGTVYAFLFDYLPGFIVFRDPTKFYLLTAIAFSLLIPMTLHEGIKRFPKLSRFGSIAYVCFIIFWGILLWPAVTGSLSGTFQKRELPKEYKEFNTFMDRENKFFRVMWVPRQHRFTKSTPDNPSVEAYAAFHATSSAEIVKKMSIGASQEYLSSIGVRYVVIPYDVYGETFLDDRKYSEKEREKVEKSLDKIAWLKKIQDGKITVYELSEYKEHIYTLSRNTVSFKKISSTKYIVSVEEKKGTLFFSENYHPLWIAITDAKTISPKNENGIMRFEFMKNNNSPITLIFTGEKYYQLGKILSAVTLFLILAFLGMLQWKNYARK